MPELEIDHLLNRIREAIKKHKLPRVQLAQRGMLHPNTLTKINRPDWAPSVETIRTLERLLFPSGKEGAPQRSRAATE
jgi:ribosome-binding protein aMBF1 (putative translation factor)